MQAYLDGVKTYLNNVRISMAEQACGRHDDGGDRRDGRRYHHGALRESLIATAEALLEERGVEGFTLRECARRAGVSPAAPAHHFGNVGGLLTAIATLGFAGLADALEAGAVDSDGTPRGRLEGIGRG